MTQITPICFLKMISAVKYELLCINDVSQKHLLWTGAQPRGYCWGGAGLGLGELWSEGVPASLGGARSTRRDQRTLNMCHLWSFLSAISWCVKGKLMLWALSPVHVNGSLSAAKCSMSIKLKTNGITKWKKHTQLIPPPPTDLSNSTVEPCEPGHPADWLS